MRDFMTGCLSLGAAAVSAAVMKHRPGEPLASVTGFRNSFSRSLVGGDSSRASFRGEVQSHSPSSTAVAPPSTPSTPIPPPRSVRRSARPALAVHVHRGHQASGCLACWSWSLCMTWPRPRSSPPASSPESTTNGDVAVQGARQGELISVARAQRTGAGGQSQPAARKRSLPHELGGFIIQRTCSMPSGAMPRRVITANVALLREAGPTACPLMSPSVTSTPSRSRSKARTYFATRARPTTGILEARTPRRRRRRFTPGGEQPLELVEVAGPRRRDERGQQPAARPWSPARRRSPVTRLRARLTSWRTAGSFRLQDLGDLRVRVVERLPQHVGGPLVRVSLSSSTSTANSSASARSAPRYGSALVSTGSGSHGPMYVSRRPAPTAAALIASRVVASPGTRPG